MDAELRGSLTGDGLKIGIITSRFSGEPCDRLLASALKRLAELGVDDNDVITISVPGAYEIPRVVREMVDGRPQSFDAIITLGCVIRGETPHFDFVAGPCAEALMKIQCEYTAFNTPCPPVIFGVLTTDNREQAIARSGGAHSDKGRDCAEAAIEMANLMKSMGRSKA
ncbi:6,7-dimethyl-8-ribityllumazine synthase [bacterium TMED181]|nr:6,7-dimethyl-8-ribityllumazine synthase [Planctomycetota bacterium]OUW44767.1 MAG: 6,7-dimethyl-8-ribityllumazine synthase [bacterium TMED181]